VNDLLIVRRLPANDWNTILALGTALDVDKQPRLPIELNRSRRAG